MDRKKKPEYGSLYTAICCFAVVAAIIGFASTRSKKKNIEENEQIAKEMQLNEETKETEEETVIPEYDERPKQTETASVGKNTIVSEEISFSRPVDGKVITEFSGEELVYNEALKDWRTHSGIDLEAKIGQTVVAAANGVVEKVFDSNMGRCIVIDHKNGYKTVYSNLTEDTSVCKGDEIAEGDVLGTIGNTALGDATDVPHLHFEILYKEENINPTEFLE